MSGSRSSSSSSSTNPPKEKIGVRSSCEAVAMNFLRADSSWASWRCIVVEGDRQLPQLVARVHRDRLIEVPGRHLLGGQLEALDPLGQRPRHQVAADQRQQQRDPARHQDLVADGGHRADDVRGRRRVDDHRGRSAVVRDRVGRLGHRAGARALGAGAHARAPGRLARHRERQRRGGRAPARVGQLGQLEAARDLVDQQQRDAVAGGQRGGVDVVLHASAAARSSPPCGRSRPNGLGASRASWARWSRSRRVCRPGATYR